MSDIERDNALADAEKWRAQGEALMAARDRLAKMAERLLDERDNARRDLRGAVALLEEVRKRSGRPFGGHAPYDLAARIERFLDDGVYEPHPATLDDGGR